MAFGNGFLLQAILACNIPCVDLQHYNSTPQTKNIRRKIFRFYGGYGADGGSLPGALLFTHHIGQAIESVAATDSAFMGVTERLRQSLVLPMKR